MDNVPHGYCHCGCGSKTSLAKQTARKYGYVKGEPIRFINGHQSRMPKPMRRFDPDVSKICTGCGETKPGSAFGRRNKRDDGTYGRKARCKDCCCQANREWNAANEARKRERDRTYREVNREHRLQYNREYHQANRDRINARIRAWAETNQERKNEQRRAWYANSDRGREYAREWQRQWREAHPELAREKVRRRNALRKQAAIGSFTVEQLEQRLSMFAGCWVCGRANEQVDHVKPLAKGGAHCLSNLRPICGSCNARKNDRWPYPTSVRAAAG